MPYITTNDGAKLFFEERGVGRSLVFIGGWCMSTWWWRYQLEGLSEGFRCIAYDPRAYGRSTKVRHGHRMARHARDLFDLLGALDIADVIAIGWSTGAATLLAYSDVFCDERLGGLVLVDQSPCNVNRDDWEWGFGTGAEATGFIEAIAADHRSAAGELVDLMFVEPVAAGEREVMVEEIIKTPAAAASELERDDLHQDWRDVLPRIRVPTLVIAGAQSKVFPTAGVRYMADRIPNARFASFEHSGHCPFIEERERFNEEIRDFARPTASERREQHGAQETGPR
jgi:non-heme chloroperoxidase